MEQIKINFFSKLNTSIISFLRIIIGGIVQLQKPTDELGKAYVSFMRVSLDQLRQRVVDEIYVLSIFEVRSSFRAALHVLAVKGNINLSKMSNKTKIV